MRRFVLAATLVLSATAAFALDETLATGTRIGIITDSGASRASRNAERATVNLLPKYLSTDLRRAGYDAHVLNATYDELHDGDLPVNDDYLLEIALTEGHGENYGGVGVGHRAVGAEVSIVSAHLGVELRVYDAHTFELMRTFELDATSVTPAITGVGVGDWRSWLFVQLPIFSQAPYRVAAHAIARDAAKKIARPARD
jgi:hypothetical protein